MESITLHLQRKDEMNIINLCVMKFLSFKEEMGCMYTYAMIIIVRSCVHIIYYVLLFCSGIQFDSWIQFSFIHFAPHHNNLCFILQGKVPNNQTTPYEQPLSDSGKDYSFLTGRTPWHNQPSAATSLGGGNWARLGFRSASVSKISLHIFSIFIFKTSHVRPFMIMKLMLFMKVQNKEVIHGIGQWMNLPIVLHLFIFFQWPLLIGLSWHKLNITFMFFDNKITFMTTNKPVPKGPLALNQLHLTAHMCVFSSW